MTFPKRAGSTYEKALLLASRCEVLLGQEGGQCHRWGSEGGVLEVGWAVM